ncbi:MAG: hypothetical protein V1800_02110 [Candidatus Latescibacterota bacterium]
MAKKQGAFHVAQGQRQLFLDEHGVAQLENMTRTMHTPEKKGAVVAPDLPWEMGLQTRSAPAWDPDEKLFKLWMPANVKPAYARFEDGSDATTYAESPDGIHWTKPVLRQYEIKGSKENNFVVVPGVDWSSSVISNVVYDPDDPDRSRRYKGLANWISREPIVSPDGIHWKRLDVSPMPSEDESSLSYDRETRTFIATVKQTTEHGRSDYLYRIHPKSTGRTVLLSTSKDFEYWTEPEIIFHADQLDLELGRENIKARLADATLQQPFWNTPEAYNVDVYHMGVFRYEGLYIGMPAMFHVVGCAPKHPSTVGFHLVQLACSRDLRTWQRLGDRKPFIGPSPIGIGAYDLTQILGPASAVVHGDELWFYYTGIKYRGDFEYEGGGLDPERGAVCLAVLRRDGFISLDAGTKEGVLLTEPFMLDGGRLHVNVDAPDGDLRVEILDKETAVLAASLPLKGDHPGGEIKWRQGGLAHLQGKVVRLRFTLRKGRFYSYWVMP